VPPPRTATVLIVDDFDAVRTLLRKQLTDQGHTVLEAGDGIEALQLVRRQGGAIDLVLADVVLPGMNGTQLADRLTSEFPGMAIILMSAFAPAGLGRVGFRDAVIPVLQKPFDAGHLTEVMRSTLQRERTSGPVTVIQEH